LKATAVAALIAALSEAVGQTSAVLPAQIDIIPSSDLRSPAKTGDIAEQRWRLTPS
jgi:hypothetical protein